MDLILIIIIFSIPLIAQIYVSRSYNKYKKIYNDKNTTGYEVARKILDENNLKDMYIVETNGTMSDHYDSSRKIIRLSKEVYHGTSIASLAIAAHECGHAIQDKENYFFMRIRSLIFPIINLGTKIAYIILVVGLILQISDLLWAAVITVGLGLIFQIITLPVEFDATKRAKKEIDKYKIASKDEQEGINSMLKAAALTYVAGVLSSALELLRILSILNRRD